MVWILYSLFTYLRPDDRLHKQYLGEHLSDGVNNSPAAARTQHRSVAEPATKRMQSTAAASRPSVLPGVLPAMLRKEWLTMRGNTGQLIGLVTPLIFVWIMSRGLFGHQRVNHVVPHLVPRISPHSRTAATNPAPRRPTGPARR